MGGTWERMIGSARSILYSMVSKIHEGNYTHNVLATFMAEVSAIIHNIPLVQFQKMLQRPLV